MSEPYVFGTVPDPYQRDVFEKTWEDRSHALFLEMGLGKTKILIDTMCRLWEAGKIGAALVVCPKGVLHTWTTQELPRHLPPRINAVVAHWRPSANQKEQAAIDATLKQNVGALPIFVVNYDAFATKRGVAAAEAFFAAHERRGVMLVLDESTAIKNPDARRTKALLRLARRATYRRIATGAPITRAPLDIWAQMAMLDDAPLGLRSYYAFRARYAVVQRRLAHGRQFSQIVGYRNLDDMQSRLQGLSTRLLKADCLDLPEKVYLRREVELTPEQQRMYASVRRAAMAELDQLTTLTAPLVITRMLRLHQIVCGIFQPDDAPEPILLPSRRIDALCEVVDEAGGKIIVWANYRKNIEEIERALSTVHGPRSVVTYYGSTPFADRQAAVEQFQDPASPVRFFVAHPKTGGSGLTLTQGTTVVYFSNNHDLDLRAQSEDRSHRRGQGQTVTYVDLVSPGTVDEVILRALREKINLSSSVLGDAWREWVI